MNAEREIVKKLFESRGYDEDPTDQELEEASFEANGSTYKCAFGKYYKDGEQITRDDYFKAKDGGSVGGSSSKDPTKEIVSMYSSGETINDIAKKMGMDHNEVKDHIKKARSQNTGGTTSSGTSKKSGGSSDSLSTDDMRDELVNAASYGWKGTPQNINSKHGAKSNDIFNKYGVNTTKDIEGLSDEDVSSLYKELDDLHSNVSGAKAAISKLWDEDESEMPYEILRARDDYLDRQGIRSKEDVFSSENFTDEDAEKFVDYLKDVYSDSGYGNRYSPYPDWLDY